MSSTCRHRAAALIVLGRAIAGALDIASAFAFYGLRGVSPVRILQSIVSGLLGAASYGGGALTTTLGLFLHFFITISAAATFYGSAAASGPVAFAGNLVALDGRRESAWRFAL